MAFWDKLFKGGGIVEQVGDLADRFITTKEDREKFKEALREYEKELKKIAAEDRDSAREMQKEALKQDDTFSKRFLYRLAIILVIATFVAIAALFFVEIPESNKDIVNFALGTIVGTGFASVVTFFFGSSETNNNPFKNM